jgi:outer membrane protein OmpA-like peptidoglycan-associated protein
MPTVAIRARPLFLVPSLMEGRLETNAILADLSPAASDSPTDTAVTRAVAKLLSDLESLIVEANLAGYEVTTIAASTGPNATAASLCLSVATYLVDPANQSWDDIVGVSVPWGSISAALALEFTPRLALREGIDAGSSLVSSYGIPFSTPASWTGSVDSNNGGWIATTVATGTAISLPDDLSKIAGKSGGTDSPARELKLAIRAAAAARWDSHGRGPDQLANCALGPLFDPDAWVYPTGDRGGHLLADEVEGGVWGAASGWRPTYDELVELRLEELLLNGRGNAGSIRALDMVRDGLRNELVRRRLGDPDRISPATMLQGELGARYDAELARLDRFGREPWPVDLFFLLELGLISLQRRVPEEESLPVVIEREWTEPILTGWYEEVGDVDTVPIEELTSQSEAEGWFDYVAGQSNVVAVHQAGDRIQGFWQERRYQPGGGEPVKFDTWLFDGTRDRSSSDLRFDVVFASGEVFGPGVCTFTETDAGVHLAVDWEGDRWEVDRRKDLSLVLLPGATEPVASPTPLIRPHLSDSELAALDPQVRHLVEAPERYPLHPSELGLLDGITNRLIADLEAIAARGGVDLDQHMALCDNFTTAFGYFHQGGSSSLPIRLARGYIQFRLISMEGNNSPLDTWVGGPPETYWHALVAKHAELPCAGITAGLGLSPADAQALSELHKYRWKFRSSLAMVDSWTLKMAQKATVDKAVQKAFVSLAKAPALVLAKIDDVEFGIKPDVQWDPIEAEFQKIGPYPDPDWPGDEDSPQSVRYTGWLFGLGLSASAGMNLSWETEWSTVNTMQIPWSPDDFAGPFVTAGVHYGVSTLGGETVGETIVNYIFGSILPGPVRFSGDLSYTQFITHGKEDVWAFQIGMTNSWGAFAEVGVGGTVGSLTLGEEPEDPAELIDIVTFNGETKTRESVSFDVGRSELNDTGKDLLRDAAAYHLHELASPATSLKVVGHANPGDARELYNLTLSERRAANVVRYLQAFLGPLFAVPPERMRIQGLGQQEAEVEGGTAEEWRRVDVHINGRLAIRMDSA